jgi:hypothetical protein
MDDELRKRGTSAADFKFLHYPQQTLLGGTGIIKLLVPFVSEVRVKAC